jgi:hypothetical protein
MSYVSTALTERLEDVQGNIAYAQRTIAEHQNSVLVYTERLSKLQLEEAELLAAIEAL